MIKLFKTIQQNMNWITTHSTTTTTKKEKKNCCTKETGPFLFNKQITYNKICVVNLCFFFRLFEIDAEFCCCCFFKCNDKDQLKLFILKFTQWTTKWSSIDQLPIVIVYQWWKNRNVCIFKRVSFLFWTRQYTMISFSNHTSTTTTTTKYYLCAFFFLCAAFLSAILPFVCSPFQTFFFSFCCCVFVCENMKRNRKDGKIYYYCAS